MQTPRCIVPRKLNHDGQTMPLRCRYYSHRLVLNIRFDFWGRWDDASSALHSHAWSDLRYCDQRESPYRCRSVQRTHRHWPFRWCCADDRLKFREYYKWNGPNKRKMKEKWTPPASLSLFFCVADELHLRWDSISSHRQRLLHSNGWFHQSGWHW